jgi:hypothetical protein
MEHPSTMTISKCTVTLKVEKAREFPMILARAFSLGAMLLAAAAGVSQPAKAAAFAGVDNAYWQTDFLYYGDGQGNYTEILPGGVDISCFGDAGSSGQNGCQGSGSLSLTNESAQDIVRSLQSIGGISVTNNSGIDLPGFLVFRTMFSAFNPGGPSIGAQVDYPLLEYAAFSSSVFGPEVADMHGCNTLTGPDFFGPNACGVVSPDSSQVDFAMGPLAAGQTETATYQIDIQVQAIGVPEPATFALFAFGIAGAATIRRRRQIA